MGLLFLSSRHKSAHLSIYVLICETGMKKTYCAGIFKLCFFSSEYKGRACALWKAYKVLKTKHEEMLAVALCVCRVMGGSQAEDCQSVRHSEYHRGVRRGWIGEVLRGWGRQVGAFLGLTAWGCQGQCWLPLSLLFGRWVPLTTGLFFCQMESDLNCGGHRTKWTPSRGVPFLVWRLQPLF